MEGLSAAFDTTLLTMTGRPGGPDDETVAAALAEAVPDVTVRTVDGPMGGSRPAQLRSLFGRASWSFGRYTRAGLPAAVTDVLAADRFDIVHADDLGAAIALPDVGPALSVYGSHNIEYRIIDGDRRSGSSLPRRLFSTIEHRKVVGEEQRAWEESDLTLAVSSFDADVIAEHLHRAGARGQRAGADRVVLCPNGTDPAAPGQRRVLDPSAEIRLLFVGSAAFTPYERGLAWFVGEVWPDLRDRHDIVLDVVGERPKRPIEAPGVTYRGYVDSLDEWYERADAVVVPVFEGSGTRLKLVEAATRRRPIITTELGAQGLPLVAGVHYQRATEPHEYLAAVAGLVDERAAIDAMVDGATAAVEPLLWPRIAEGLVERYQQCLAEMGTGAAGRLT